MLLHKKIWDRKYMKVGPYRSCIIILLFAGVGQTFGQQKEQAKRHTSDSCANGKAARWASENTIHVTVKDEDLRRTGYYIEQNIAITKPL